MAGPGVVDGVPVAVAVGVGDTAVAVGEATTVGVTVNVGCLVGAGVVVPVVGVPVDGVWVSVTVGEVAGVAVGPSLPPPPQAASDTASTEASPNSRIFAINLVFIIILLR